MRLASVLAVVGCCFLLAPSQSFAQLGQKQQQPATGAGNVFTKITPEQLSSVLTAAGYRSQVASKDNQKWVTTTMHGFNAVANPFACDNRGCSGIHFVVWFNDKVSLDFVNAWNNQWFLAKMAIDKDGDVAFSLDIYLDGGVTSDNIKSNAKMFDGLLGEATKFSP
jgi:putative sensory transduction regulator